MKILLTHGYFLSEDSKEQAIMKPYVPLGILSVSAWLEQNGFDNEVFDSTFSTFENLCGRLLETKPDAVGIYTNLMTRVNVIRIVRFIRSKTELAHTKIILGGPEVRQHAEPLMNVGADVIVIGEGEESMHEVVVALNAKQKDLSAIKGIQWKNERSEIVINPERELLKDINQLPFPNRKKVDLQKYFDAWKNAHGESSVSVSTMRGCPYTCKWCSRAVYGLSYRRRSPELVADEIEELKRNYTFDSIWFVDDVFTVSHKWMKDFAAVIAERKLKIRYEIISRSDRLSEEILDLLAQSGCFRIWIGAESGSQKVIDAMDRRVDVKNVREMIQLTRKKGMEAGTFIMLGYPGETESDIHETVRHLIQSNPHHFTITLAYPIRGTELYEETRDNFTHVGAWETSNDRDIDFKRAYPRRYYDYAIRYVVNTVKWKTAKEDSPMKRMRYFAGAMRGRLGMAVSK
ncbi:MAG TPA: radical SAM protein [Bacteroidia bacterium]|nr:radical SAM protein [Bacteroidia bacterium]